MVSVHAPINTNTKYKYTRPPQIQIQNTNANTKYKKKGAEANTESGSGADGICARAPLQQVGICARALASLPTPHQLPNCCPSYHTIPTTTLQHCPPPPPCLSNHTIPPPKYSPPPKPTRHASCNTCLPPHRGAKLVAPCDYQIEAYRPT